MSDVFSLCVVIEQSVAPPNLSPIDPSQSAVPCTGPDTPTPPQGSSHGPQLYYFIAEVIPVLQHHAIQTYDSADIQRHILLTPTPDECKQSVSLSGHFTTW
jgi:hypothetical protein